MAIVDDDGIVLRSLRYGDTSRIATLLTRRQGKVHVIAKGARNTKSPFGAALEILTQAQISFYLKKNRTLHFLKAAVVERAFMATVASPLAYHIASAGLEFVDRVLPDEDPNPAVYGALERFLVGGEREPENARAEARLKAFQLHTVALLGYAPQLDVCARCGRPIEELGGFSAPEGGLVCRSCPPRGPLMPLSPAGVRLLRTIVAAPRATPRPRSVREAPAGGRIPPAAADREVASMVEAFLRYHVTGYRGLRSLRSLAEWRGLGVKGTTPR